MRCTFAFLVMVISFMGCAGPRQAAKLPAPESGSSLIPDERLRSVVRDSLNIADGEPITAADLEMLTHLKAERDRIVRLDGIEHAANLVALNVNGNAIGDLGPLAALSELKRLHLGHNGITDISPISGLTHLQHLHLHNNAISDINPPARDWFNLATLNLARNRVADLSPLAGLGKLTRLTVRGNPLSTESIRTRIPEFRARGMRVSWESPRGGVNSTQRYSATIQA